MSCVSVSMGFLLPFKLQMGHVDLLERLHRVQLANMLYPENLVWLCLQTSLI